MSVPVLMIAFWQAVAVFVLCIMFAKNRGYAVLIGLAGCVVVTITGSYRYGWLDVLFVIAATLAAVWKLTPYGEGETRGEALAFAAKAVGVVLGLVACGAAGLWYYANHGSKVSVPDSQPASTPAPVDDWVFAGSEQGSQVYFNSATLRTAKESVIVSVLLDFDEPGDVNGIIYSSLVFELVTDCSSKKISFADPKYYSGRKGSGAMVFFEQVQSPYEVPQSGSPFLKLAKTSCDVLDYRNAKK